MVWNLSSKVKKALLLRESYLFGVWCKCSWSSKDRSEELYILSFRAKVAHLSGWQCFKLAFLTCTIISGSLPIYQSTCCSTHLAMGWWWCQRYAMTWYQVEPGFVRPEAQMIWVVRLKKKNPKTSYIYALKKNTQPYEHAVVPHPEPGT